MPVTTRFTSAGLSDTGRRRDQNEDRILCDPDRGVFAVIDGMGGHAAGEKAAAIAYDVLRDRLSRQTGTAEQRVREAIALANNEIHRLSSTHEDWRWMACVLTVAVLEDDSITLGHVGDSRAYLLTRERVQKLTRDHSPVGEREDAGEISEADAMVHPRRNEVYRDVGSEEHSPDDPGFVDIERAKMPADGVLLLCSDGLTDQVPSGEVRRILERNAGTSHRAARELIDAANRAGGKDNISVIVVEGGSYAQAVRSRSAGQSTPEPARKFRVLWYALTGALLGVLLAAWLWSRQQSPPPLHQGPPDPPAVTLTVRPGASISEALERASPGDTVMVLPGIYRENLTLRPGVKLISSEPHKAVIEAPGIIVSGLGANGATLAGFRLVSPRREPADVAVQVEGGVVELANLEIRGMRRAAVELTGEGSTVLKNSTLADNPGSGLIVSGKGTPVIEGNTLLRNGRRPGDPRPAIEIRDTAQPVLRGNTLNLSGAEEIWAHPLFDTAAALRQNKVGRSRQDNGRKVKVLTD